MGALPKKKHSRTRIGGRRSHMGLRLVSLSQCPQCRSVKLPHRVCPNCGYYRGREVIAQEETRSQE